MPGSGKTTRAREITALGGVVIANADALTPMPGGTVPEPDFDFWQMAGQLAMLRTRLAMLHLVPLIVLDNCHGRHAAWAPYVDIAKAHGYAVVVYPLHGWPVEPATLEMWRRRSPHPVTSEIMASMASRWE